MVRSGQGGEDRSVNQAQHVETRGCATGLWGRPELFWFGARPVGIHRFQSASGASIQQDLTLSAFTATTITSPGRLSTLLAGQCLFPASSNKNPDHAGIFCPRFRFMHHQIGRPMRPQNLHVPLAEVIEVIVKLSPRFRTIQICPKDLLATLREAERVVGRPLGSVGCWWSLQGGRGRCPTSDGVSS